MCKKIRVNERIFRVSILELYTTFDSELTVTYVAAC